MVSAAVGAGEEAVLAGERQGPDGALDDVVVELDAAVAQEEGEACPARERVAYCLSELGLLADSFELGAQPRLQFVDESPASRLSSGETGVAVLARICASMA